MKEMVGGCCVCSDERGFYENPLVYCDGQGCNVAVHQACYGIVSVPTGPWFCRKCESQERQARVKCELCPSKDGALKRTDSGQWAHVVCALYIPEVRFGNNNTMEPIILQLVPNERYSRTCSLCEEQGKEAKAKVGACMQCNKPGCKHYFHVTCAQAVGLLCEEAGNNMDNVKYCGYCSHHYQKLKKEGNIKPIPAFKPIPNDTDTPESSPEKFLPEIRQSLQQSMINELRHPKKKTAKTGSISSNASMASPSSVHSNSNHAIHSFKAFESKIKTEINSEDIITSTKTSQSPLNADSTAEKSCVDSVIKKKKKSITSPASTSPPTGAPMSPMAPNSTTTVDKPPNQSLFASIFNSSLNSTNSTTNAEKVIQNMKTNEMLNQNTIQIKRTKTDITFEKKKYKRSEFEPPFKTKSAAKDYSDSKPLTIKRVRRKKNEINANDLTNGVLNAVITPVFVKADHNYHRSIPVNHPNMTPLQNGYNSTDKSNTNSVFNNTITSSQFTFNGAIPPNVLSTEASIPPKTNSKSKSPNNDEEMPQTLEQLLERQWAQGSQFIVDQAQHFDIASLLSCLHQLRSENNRLEERVRELMARRDQLLAVNARLTLPANNVFPINGALSSLNSTNIGISGQNQSPAHSALSAASSPRTHTNSPSETQPKGVRSSAQGMSPSQRNHSMTSFQQNNETIGLTHHSSHLYSSLTHNYSANGLNSSNPSAQSSPSQSQSYYSLPSHSQNTGCIRKTNGSDKR